jgi:hypothetical protein
MRIYVTENKTLPIFPSWTPGFRSPLSLTIFSITSVNPQSLKTSAHPTNWAVKLQLREVALRLHLRRIRSELNERRQIDFLNNTTCRSFPHEVELRGLAGGSFCGGEPPAPHESWIQNPIQLAPARPNVPKERPDSRL